MPSLQDVTLILTLRTPQIQAKSHRDTPKWAREAPREPKMTPNNGSQNVQKPPGRPVDHAVGHPFVSSWVPLVSLGSITNHVCGQLVIQLRSLTFPRPRRKPKQKLDSPMLQTLLNPSTMNRNLHLIVFARFANSNLGNMAPSCFFRVH